MTNYEQLMARLNKTTVEATDNEQSFLSQAIDTVDRITSEAYGVTVAAVAAQYFHGAAHGPRPAAAVRCRSRGPHTRFDDDS